MTRTLIVIANPGEGDIYYRASGKVRVCDSSYGIELLRVAPENVQAFIEDHGFYRIERKSLHISEFDDIVVVRGHDLTMAAWVEGIAQRFEADT